MALVRGRLEIRRLIFAGLGFVAIGVAFLVNSIAGDGSDVSGYVGAGWIVCGVLFMITGVRRMRADGEKVHGNPDSR